MCRPVGYLGVKLYPMGDFERPDYADTIGYIDFESKNTYHSDKARTYNNGERVPRDGASRASQRVERDESSPYSRDDRGGSEFNRSGSNQYVRSGSNAYVRSGSPDTCMRPPPSQQQSFAERERVRQADEMLARQMQQDSSPFVRPGDPNPYARRSNPPQWASQQGGSPNPYMRQGSRQMM